MNSVSSDTNKVRYLIKNAAPNVKLWPGGKDATGLFFNPLGRGLIEQVQCAGNSAAAVNVAIQLRRYPASPGTPVLLTL